MSSSTPASREHFTRTPDATFDSMPTLIKHCRRQRQQSRDRWTFLELIRPDANTGQLGLSIGAEELYSMTHWSFGQLCKLTRVSKEIVNRVSPDTAARIFRETLRLCRKSVRVLTTDREVRSILGASYTWLFNSELLAAVDACSNGFQPAQGVLTGATDLYCGEQDLFAFLIDPSGWTEIDGVAYTPGFYFWNSEVGCRNVGINTFWYQADSAGHLIWDAVEVVDRSWKHTANVHKSLGDIVRIIESLVAKRDARRDGFFKVMDKATRQTLGRDAEEVLKVLAQTGISRTLAKEATELARQKGRFTIFALVDALTRLTEQMTWIGDRTEAELKIARLLALVV